VALVSKEVSAFLNCESVGGSHSFKRPVKIQIADGHIEYRHGDWRSRLKRYDLWQGRVDNDGVVTITGSYIEGTGGVKPVKLSGRIKNGQLLLNGKRGVRDCT